LGAVNRYRGVWMQLEILATSECLKLEIYCPVISVGGVEGGFIFIKN
jgi:hypothetical protein